MMYPYHDTALPANEYHAMSEWSQSQLKIVLENPEKLRWRENNEVTTTGSQSLGTLIHAAVLEPDVFEKRYIIKPDDINRRGAANQAIYDRFFWEAKQNGQDVVTAADYETALACADKIRNHREASDLLLGDGPTEISLFDEINGLSCRGRPDKYHVKSGYLVDLKTTGDGNASESQWPREIIRWRYDMQAVMYLSLWHRCFGVQPKGFKHVVVETVAPYSIAIYELSRTWLEVGKVLLSEAIEIAKRCESSGVWPSYAMLHEPLECPPWEVKRVLGEVMS